jgi:hypothetical protein
MQKEGESIVQLTQTLGRAPGGLGVEGRGVPLFPLVIIHRLAGGFHVSAWRQYESSAGPFIFIRLRTAVPQSHLT